MMFRALAASVAALTLTAGIASAQTKPAAPAPAPAKPAAAPAKPAAPVVDKTHASYAFGWTLGQDLVNSGELVDIATVIRGLQDAYAKKQPAYTQEQLGAAYSGFQQRVMQKREAEFRKLASDNEAQSAGFVTKFKDQTGVITLPSGIMYRVLRPGTGAKPTATSQVEIVFQTFLAAVNVPLSGEQTPAPFKVADAPIPALKETLPLMQQGTVWEMVIPPGKLGADNPQFAKQAVTIRAALSGVK